MGTYHQSALRKPFRLLRQSTERAGTAGIPRGASLPAGKTFASWRENDSSIPLPAQHALMALEWVTRAENLAIVGPSGTGESHFAEALAHKARELRLGDGDRIGFDYLILVTGLEADFRGIPGAAGHALPLKSLDDAVKIRTQMLRRLETVAAHPALMPAGAPVAAVGPASVTLADGQEIPAGMIVWATGVRATHLAGSLALPQTPDGRIRVQPNLSLPGHPEAFAIGDMAALPLPAGGLHPPLAHER